MVMKWGPEQDQDILIFILEHSEVKVPYAEIAAHLGCTPKAVTHRIANLKKAVKEHRENGGVNASENETPTPPKKKRSRAAAPKEKTGKKAKKSKIVVEEDEDGDVWANGENSPSVNEEERVDAEEASI